MNTEQIYSIVNEVNAQAFGESALQVVDTSSLISLGNVVLSSQSNTEAFLNTLAQRIGKTIYRFRAYNNKFKDLVISDMEFGAIMQKLKVEMPQAEADDMYNLVDGQSLDHYEVAKPVAKQKLFVTRTPYRFKITIQRETLKEAFTSDSGISSFIGMVFGEVQNAIELALENLGRITIATAIAETSAAQKINLLTDYNAENGTSLTKAQALNDSSFLNYAMYRINNTIDMIQDMSALYNDGTTKTFTSKENMKIRVLSSFKRRLETVTEYAAFHDEYVKIDGAYSTLNFWQSEQTPDGIIVERPSDGAETAVDNVVAFISDKDAFGIYQISEDVATTPVNARGLYYNTYWHEKQSRFIDKSENMVVFTLN